MENIRSKCYKNLRAPNYAFESKDYTGQPKLEGISDYFIAFCVGELANYFLGKGSKENLNIYLNICKFNLKQYFSR